jgi:Ca2+/Na+ antiporter
MNPETLGIVGAVVGSTVGILGGVIGTYFSVKNTNGPRERTIVLRASLLLWLLVLAFVAGTLLLPEPERWWLWVAYPFLLVVGIAIWNRRWLQIRQQESGGGDMSA